MFSTNYDKQNKIWSGANVEPLYNIEHYSLGEILFNKIKGHPNVVIQIDDFDGKSMTNKEALAWATRIAMYFKKIGLRHDDVIGIIARTSTYLTPVALGCLFNCTPFHGVNPTYQQPNIEHCFGLTKPKVIFCDASDYDKVHNATKSFEPQIFTIDERIEGVQSVLDLLEPTEEERFYNPETLSLGANQTFAILCSSGTTGLPKAVTISMHKVSLNNRLFNYEDVLFSSTGLDWMSGVFCGVANWYTNFRRILVRKPLTPDYLIELTQKYQITKIFLSTNQAVSLVECPQFKRKNLDCLELLAIVGGIVSNQTLAKIRIVLPKVMLFLVYALTETGAVAANPGMKNDNSTGKLFPGVKLRIVDESGTNVGPNEMGEVWIHMPFKWAGYYGNPIETERTMDSLGWFHTGDLGYIDDECYLYVVDRKKDILKYMGLHFWPGEIEGVIRELPEVADCCVVGLFDEHFGDVAGALVKRSKGGSLAEEQVVKHVKDRLLEPQKQLHHGVYFVEELPLNPNGKILKREVKEMFISLMKQEVDP